MKHKSFSISGKIKKSSLRNFIPTPNLTLDSLIRALDNFHQGNLAPAALAWENIEMRDDVLQGVISKRKKAISRLKWEIITLDDSQEALDHKYALQYFYNNLTASHACDGNQTGGFPLLVKQMLDALAKKYAVHEILFQTHSPTELTANFRFVPLWFFENSTGKLRLLKTNNTSETSPLTPPFWLITSADCLMESCSIAYIFKHLSLRDWIIYSERNGMPGIKGITDSHPGSPAWYSAAQSVSQFGAEFSALLTRGNDIQPIDLSSRGNLPYPQLIERMDRAMVALWRGCDLTTLAKSQAIGASVQENETSILEEDDAAMISETLNSQVDRQVLNHLFKVKRGKAYIQLQPSRTQKTLQDLQIYRQLSDMGLSIPSNHLYERFGIPQPSDDDKINKTVA